MFNPERFAGDWNRDAFLGFSAGLRYFVSTHLHYATFMNLSNTSRSCIGRKFSEVEGVSVLTALLLRYSIHLPSEKVEEFKGLTRPQQADRLLKSQAKLTLT